MNHYENGKDYVSLSWDKVPNTADGYTVQGTTDSTMIETSWKNTSTNYGKHIKILNVHPANGNYLKQWMDQNDPNTGQPVSMGLIDVTPVSLQDFNQNPNGYLKDSAGNYQYDGVYFGSSDGNNGEDLNDTSYNATAAFGQTGRSVILGHDTVALINPYLAKFSPNLGLSLVNYNGDYLGASQIVFNPAMKNGFLAHIHIY